MIASQNIRKNHALFYVRKKTLVHALIINPPPDILLTSVKSVTPPALIRKSVKKQAERVVLGFSIEARAFLFIKTLGGVLI